MKIELDLHDASLFRQDAPAQRRLAQYDTAQIHKSYLACQEGYSIVCCYPFAQGGCCCSNRTKPHRCGHPVLPLSHASSDFEVVRRWVSTNEGVPGLNLMVLTDDGRLEYLDILFPAFPNTKAWLHEVAYPQQRAIGDGTLRGLTIAGGIAM